MKKSGISEKKSGVSAKIRTKRTDKRKYITRVKLAILPVVAFVFTLLFFGPFDIALQNSSELKFRPSDVAIIMGVVSTVISAAVIFLVALLRGRVFNAVATLFISLTLAVYAQSIFFNSIVGQLTGDTINWNDYLPEMILNGFIWAAIIALPYVLWHFLKKFRKPLFFYLPVLLALMQIGGLVSVAFAPTSVTGYTSAVKSGDVYLSKEGMFDYSEKKNVVLILLDRFDLDYFNKVVKNEETKDFFNRLDGFTCYTNATAEYARTLPGAVHLINGGTEGAYTLPVQEFLDSSWSSVCGTNMIDALKKNDFTVEFYADYAELMSDTNPNADKISNLSTENLEIDYKVLTSRMLQLSLYRYAPISLKRFFWLYSGDVANEIYVESERYKIDDAEFFDELSEGITVSDTQSNFKFYHLNGPHAPYTIKADGTKSDGFDTSVEEQLQGVFVNLYKLFDDMKEKGIYDSSEIIITADHGNAVNDYAPLKKATCIGLFYKPSGASGTPLQYSKAQVSQQNVPATILKATGYENYKDFGTPLDEIGEDEDIVRYYYKSVMDLTVSGTHEAKVYKYEIRGDARNLFNWKQVEIYDVEHWFY